MHTIHVLTNANNEAYIMVLKHKVSVQTLVNNAFVGTDHDAYKNPVRHRFVRESNDLKIEYFEVPVELNTQKEILAYREQIIKQFQDGGFFVLDEKHYDILDKPADQNFSYILTNFDIGRLVAVWGKEALVRGRKNLTTGEFINQFCSV
jgi:hypothetical protein